AAEDQPQPVVRRERRGGRRLLHVGLRQLEDPAHHPLPAQQPRARGSGHDRRVRARRPALRRHQRRPAVHVQRGGLVRDHVQGPGRGGPLLGGAHRRRRGGPVRLAEGPLRPVLAGRAGGHGRGLRPPRQGTRVAGDAGDAHDEEARHRRAARGGRRRPRRL
ncbi:MAG: 3-demethylubiquinone-9 3-methyltransferase, partial [uncultured Solirubrobacteraceae bacterium]